MYFGAGNVWNNYNNPISIKISDTHIALFGYVCPTTHPTVRVDKEYGVSLLELSRIQEDIVKAKQDGADRIVINLHWGSEEMQLPKPSDVSIAHQIIDAGADMIIGHHAHVPQIVEEYNGKCIAYGLGNFIFSTSTIEKYNSENQISSKPYELRYLNRVSLGIVWNPNTVETNVKSFYFHDKQIKEHPYQSSSIIQELIKSRLYPFLYGVYERKRKLEIAVSNVLRNPSHLQMRHVWQVFKLLFGSQNQE